MLVLYQNCIFEHDQQSFIFFFQMTVPLFRIPLPSLAPKVEGLEPPHGYAL